MPHTSLPGVRWAFRYFAITVPVLSKTTSVLNYMPHTEPSGNNSAAHVNIQERGKAYHKMTVRRAGLAILGHGTWSTPLDLRGVDDNVDVILLCCTAHGLENQVRRRVVACITARIDLQNANAHDDPHSSLSRKAVRQAGLRTVTPASTAGIVSQNGRAFERLVAPQYWRTHGHHTQRQDRVMRVRAVSGASCDVQACPPGSSQCPRPRH